MSDEPNSMGKDVVNFPTNVVKSIFRNPLPSSDRGRAATSFTNFFLHVQPVRGKPPGIAAHLHDGPGAD